MTDYFDLPGESYSSLKAMLVSPLHYRYERRRPRPDRDAWRVGRASHTAVLEPHRFEDGYVVWSGGNRAGRKWEDFQSLHEDGHGHTILTVAQFAAATAIADAVRSHPLAGTLLAEQGQAELALQWIDERTGIQMKGRLDWLCSALVDVKTCRSPAPWTFSASATRLRYPMQLAIYSAALRANGFGHRPAKIIAVQNQPPWDVVVYAVPDEVLALGEREFEAALDRLARCLDEDRWPGLGAEEQTLTLPAWAYPDWEDEPVLTFDGQQLFTEATS